MRGYHKNYIISLIIINVLTLPLMLTGCIGDLCPIYRPFRLEHVTDPKFKTLYERPEDIKQLRGEENAIEENADISDQSLATSNVRSSSVPLRNHYGYMTYYAKLSNGKTCPNRSKFNIQDEGIYNNLIKNPDAIRGEKILMNSITNTCHNVERHETLSIFWMAITSTLTIMVTSIWLWIWYDNYSLSKPMKW